MREFIYFSQSAPTSGGAVKDDLMKSGRMDIAMHSVIAAFFLSHEMRTDTRFNLVFAGPPDPQKHLELQPVTNGKTGIDKIYMSKKDIAWIIKRMLYKHKEGKKTEVFPGYWIQRQSFLKLAESLHEQGRPIYLLDKKGRDIRHANIKDNPVFIIGDHDGMPAKELKRLKAIADPVSVGKKTYFASHTIAIVHNELDRREEAGLLHS